ncbi:MAG: SPOR domain-containing protein [Pseudomonadota bacterium]
MIDHIREAMRRRDEGAASEAASETDGHPAAETGGVVGTDDAAENRAGQPVPGAADPAGALLQPPEPMDPTGEALDTVRDILFERVMDLTRETSGPGDAAQPADQPDPELDAGGRSETVETSASDTMPAREAAGQRAALDRPEQMNASSRDDTFEQVTDRADKAEPSPPEDRAAETIMEPRAPSEEMVAGEAFDLTSVPSMTEPEGMQTDREDAGEVASPAVPGTSPGDDLSRDALQDDETVILAPADSDDIPTTRAAATAPQVPNDATLIPADTGVIEDPSAAYLLSGIREEDAAEGELRRAVDTEQSTPEAEIPPAVAASSDVVVGTAVDATDPDDLRRLISGDDETVLNVDGAADETVAAAEDNIGGAGDDSADPSVRKSARRTARRGGRRRRGATRRQPASGAPSRGAIAGLGAALGRRFPTLEFAVGAGGRGLQLRVEPHVQFGVAGLVLLVAAGLATLPGDPAMIDRAEAEAAADAETVVALQTPEPPAAQPVLPAAVAPQDTAAAAERRSLERRLATARAELESLTATLASERAALRDSERRAEIMATRMAETREGLDEARGSIESLRGRLTEQADEIRTLRQTLNASVAAGAQRDASAASATGIAQPPQIAGGFGGPSMPQAPIALASIAPDSFARPTARLSSGEGEIATSIQLPSSAAATTTAPVVLPSAIGAAAAPARVAQPGASAPARPSGGLGVAPTVAVVAALNADATEAGAVTTSDAQTSTTDGASPSSALSVQTSGVTPPPRSRNDNLASIRQIPGSQLDGATALQGDVYVQAGVFTAKSYGFRLHENLTSRGIAADVLPTTFLGRDAIRVRAGPFETAEERRFAMTALRELGINDALPVSR